MYVNFGNYINKTKKYLNMSYSYLGHFVDVKNKRVIASADVSILKSLNEHSYACDLKDITPTGSANDDDYTALTKTIYYEFISYYKASIITDFPELNFVSYRKKDWNKTKNAYFIEENVYKENKERLSEYEVKPTIEEMTTFNEDSDDIIILYEKSIKSNDGKWYRYSDFANAEEKIKEAYFKKRDEFNELKKLRNTKDYFEMSEDGKNSYLEEIGYMEESVEEYESEYYAIEYITSIFNFFKEDVGFAKFNEFGEIKYAWYYEDKREIELYIEVC